MLICEKHLSLSFCNMDLYDLVYLKQYPVHYKYSKTESGQN